MSRIEEALRRARGGAQDTADAEASGVVPPAETRPEELAEAPWSFDTPSAAARPRANGARTGSTTGVVRPAAPPAPRGSLIPDAPQSQSGLPGPAEDSQFGVFGGFDPSVDERVTVSKDMPPISVEQYRRLAATLHHAQADRGVRSVMITSAVTGEGKTLTATNLALTLSQSYRRRVLLIDADLRRPSMHRIFQAPNVSGLTDGLKQTEERKLAIIEVAERLALLTAGRPDPDPMGGLVSDRMRRILEEAVTRFDWVVIDTPPVALMPDANLLAAMVDAALLVVNARQTPYDLVQRAVDAVGRDKLLGVVLNKVEDSGFAGDARYHAYYASYGRR